MKNRPLLDMNDALSLEFFLTNRCNMDCSYCSSRHFIHEKEKKTLTFDQLKQAIDVISSDKYIQDKFDGKVHIDFTGGEPLLEFEVMKETIRYARTKEIDFAFELETNGTLLTESRIDYLVRNDIDIRLSLDGYKSINDAHRRFQQFKRFRNNSKISVFEAIMRKLKKGLLNTRYMDRVLVGAILDSKTMDRLPDIMKFFKDDIGFKRMEIGPQAYEIWNPAGIKRLINVLRSLKPEFIATLDYKMGIRNKKPAFHELQFTQSKAMGTEYEDLARKTITLFYDGYYYLCDFVVKPPLDKKFSVGDIQHGIDFKRIKTIASLPMFKTISRKCEHKSGFFSPVEGYYWGIVHKFTPDRLNEMLENTSRLNKVFNEEMERYVKLQRLFQRLIMTPSFGDFAHLPKYMSKKEIKSFRLIIRNDSDIVRLREGIDYFLYSPGNGKKLILDVMDTCHSAGHPAGRQSIDVMEGMVMYALMKARYLKKRIKLIVKFDTSAFSARGGPASCSRGASAFGGGWDVNSWRYLNEHGVRVGICFAGSGG